ncbi:MAG: calcium-binding protein, partial [Trichodesmium sp. St2_bin6]|nr:calcium-binding protein [Trichodesmium sp. St2_bin6]
RLNGGPGDDELTGGASIDRFIFNTNKEFNSQDIGTDRITDFNIGQDIILLDLDTFTALDSSADAGLSEDDFATVSSAGDAATAEAAIVYNSVSGALYYNTNGSEDGFGIGAEFANLDNSPDLAASNFQLR